MYALNIDSTGRVLSATLEQFDTGWGVHVAVLPKGDISEYRLVDGTFVHDPIPHSNVFFPPTQTEINAANIDYLAMMAGVEL